MKLHARLVICPCGQQSLAFDPELIGVVAPLAERRVPMPAILVEVEHAARVRIPEQREETP